MGQFVNQNGIEFTLTQQTIDADGKQDTRIKDSTNFGTGMPVAEAHRDAICYEIRRHTTVAATAGHLRLASLSPYTRQQSHKHEEGASYPYDGKHHGRPAFRHIPYRSANSAERPSPR